MPLYFFHVYDDEIALDEEGREFAGLEPARQDAIRAIRGLAAEQVEKGRLNLHHRVEIADAGGKVLDTVSFRDAIAVEG